MKPVYPFSAIVGQEGMKKALLLAVIDPSISGILIRGQRGTAKSTAVRALAHLLPALEVVAGCPYHCHPADPDLMCVDCLKQFRESGKPLPAATRETRVIELPVGATADRVIGTLDMEKALRTGTRSFEPGILAEVHRGFLYVDEINLLPDHLVDLLLDAAAMGTNYVEREGISFSHPSRFVLVGTMNPEEGELRPQLMDRFGLCVETGGITDPAARREVILRRIAYDRNPEAFSGEWKEADKSLRGDISRARERLKDLSLSGNALDTISRICSDLKIEGHRGDITIAKAAAALAAYYGHPEILQEDVREAAILALPHRIRHSLMDDEVSFSVETIDKALENMNRDALSPEITPPGEKKKSKAGALPSDSVLSTRVFPIGETPGELFFPEIKPKKNHCGAMGKSLKSEASISGAYVRSELPRGRPRDIALDATLRTAAALQKGRGRNGTGPLLVRAPDIRVKYREKKNGRVIQFVVDASGSMGVQQQMRETKAAILSLLTKAYQKRDRVGLVVFQGSHARLVLPPTNSVDLARKHLKTIPTGGKTPLASGLALGLSTLLKDRLKHPEQVPLLIVVSDGKANIAFNGGDPIDDAISIARRIRKEQVEAMFVETEADPCAFGYGWDLSKIMRADYTHLGQVRARRLVSLIS
jgi:magnesium chelatase subunit D